MGDKRSNISIPVIDISDASARDTADQLVDASTRYGFVFVRGEGIGFTGPILDNIFALVKTNPFLLIPDGQTMLMTWIVAKVLLLNHGRERRMRHPR